MQRAETKSGTGYPDRRKIIVFTDKNAPGSPEGSYSHLVIPCRPPVFLWPVSRGVLCIHRSRQKKGLFLTILILYSASNAAELLPLVVRATLVAYIAAKDGQQSIESK